MLLRQKEMRRHHSRRSWPSGYPPLPSTPPFCVCVCVVTSEDALLHAYFLHVCLPLALRPAHPSTHHLAFLHTTRLSDIFYNRRGYRIGSYLQVYTQSVRERGTGVVGRRGANCRVNNWFKFPRMFYYSRPDLPRLYEDPKRDFEGAHFLWDLTQCTRSNSH